MQDILRVKPAASVVIRVSSVSSVRCLCQCQSSLTLIFCGYKKYCVDQDCDYTKLKNLLLFGVAASVGLGTWFSLAHDALIVLHKKLQ